MRTNLTIPEDINPDIKAIILNYWKFENERFIYPPEGIAWRYNMSLTDLHQLIADNSTFHFLCAVCIECGVEEMCQTKIQKDVARIFNKSFWMCNECYIVQEREFKERKALWDKLG